MRVRVSPSPSPYPSPGTRRGTRSTAHRAGPIDDRPHARPAHRLVEVPRVRHVRAPPPLERQRRVSAHQRARRRLAAAPATGSARTLRRREAGFSVPACHNSVTAACTAGSCSHAGALASTAPSGRGASPAARRRPASRRRAWRPSPPRRRRRGSNPPPLGRPRTRLPTRSPCTRRNPRP